MEAKIPSSSEECKTWEEMLYFLVQQAWSAKSLAADSIAKVAVVLMLKQELAPLSSQQEATSMLARCESDAWKDSATISFKSMVAAIQKDAAEGKAVRGVESDLKKKDIDANREFNGNRWQVFKTALRAATQSPLFAQHLHDLRLEKLASDFAEYRVTIQQTATQLSAKLADKDKEIAALSKRLTDAENKIAKYESSSLAPKPDEKKKADEQQGKDKDKDKKTPGGPTAELENVHADGRCVRYCLAMISQHWTPEDEKLKGADRVAPPLSLHYSCYLRCSGCFFRFTLMHRVVGASTRSSVTDVCALSKLLLA
jgi:hypothetical protein